MCGIVGVWGRQDAVDVVVQGLSRLEYRGYDSAGVATLRAGGGLETRKAVGKLAALRGVLEKDAFGDHLPAAIGHTRWATHGVPSVGNAHPHVGALGQARVAVVHNGIIENFAELREELAPLLKEHGVVFMSETDTEVLPFLIAKGLLEGLEFGEAVRLTASKCRGNFAFVALADGQEGLAGYKRGAPLCVGYGRDWNALVSDPLALAGETTRFAFLPDDTLVLVGAKTVQARCADGSSAPLVVHVMDLADDVAGKHGFKHFMQKEIHDQPAVVSALLQAYTTAEGRVTLPLGEGFPKGIPQLNMVACGTAYYAALVGKYMMEAHAGIPVNVDVASEFRYRNPPFVKGGVFVAISQSGETADTLAALEHAKAAGQYVVVLTNVPTSTMARAAHAVVPLLAGREIAVASTKAFMAMEVVVTLLALALSGKDVAGEVAQLRRLPVVLEGQLDVTPALQQLAQRLAQHARHMLCLGRGVLAPLALEGALKVKEISYIHAEGYASGEMKHGPIALVDADLPVLTLATGEDPLFEKTLSNMKEVEARGGQLILVTDAKGMELLGPAQRAKMDILPVPTVPPLLAPMVCAVPLQLLAYEIAVAKGTDVDQPRNLAKSVTVE